MNNTITRWDELAYNVRLFLFGEKKFQVGSIIKLTLLVHLLLFLFFGVIAYLWALGLRISRWKLPQILLASAAGLFCFFVIQRFYGDTFIAMLKESLFDNPTGSKRQLDINLGGIMGCYLIYSVAMWPMFPVGTLVLSVWDILKDLFRQKTLEDELENKQKLKVKEDALKRKNSSNRVQGNIPAENKYITVGTWTEGDTFPAMSGLENHQGWFRFVEDVLMRHMFVIGTTGAGKTEFLLRLISEVLENTNLNLYFIDGKGDLDVAGKIATLFYKKRGIQVPIFKLGHTHYGAVYNGFRGNAEDIYNRLGAMVGVNEAEGNALYYADASKTILQLICGVGYPNLGIEPPRSFTEVQSRIDVDWLKNKYRMIPAENIVIKALEKANHVENLGMRMGTLTRSFGHVVNDKGFIIEDTPASIFSLRTQSASVDAKRFLDFFIEDTKDFIGKRQKPGARGLLIIDEFGTFKNQNITDVLSLARSSGLGVILATQDTVNLGDKAQQRKVLANCNTYMLMKTNFPEEIAEIAGTIQRLESSYQFLEGAETGLGSSRIQHQFKVDPNKVAQLGNGEMFVINSRRMALVQSKRIDKVIFDKNAVAPNNEGAVQTVDDLLELQEERKPILKNSGEILVGRLVPKGELPEEEIDDDLKA